MKTNQIIKFIIAGGVFYALLTFNIFHIGEKLLPEDKNYVESTIPQEEQDIENRYLEIDTPQEESGHFAGNYVTNLENLCKRITICNKLQFKGIFSSIEKYNYTKIVSRIAQFIDDNNKQAKEIQEVINTIEISKENGTRRWYATRDSIFFNVWSVQSPKEFINLSTHEMGHIADLGYIQWSWSKKDVNFTEFGKIVFAINDPSIMFYKNSRSKEKIRKAEAKKKDFCSWYGMTDPFEDFSECFNLYTNHNSFFKKIAKTNTILKNKYNFIASIFNGKYMSSNSQDFDQIKIDSTRRPRDTTKLNN